MQVPHIYAFVCSCKNGCLKNSPKFIAYYTSGCSPCNGGGPARILEGRAADTSDTKGRSSGKEPPGTEVPSTTPLPAARLRLKAKIATKMRIKNSPDVPINPIPMFVINDCFVTNPAHFFSSSLAGVPGFASEMPEHGTELGFFLFVF